VEEHVLALRHDLQILGPIVRLVAVPMVDLLVSVQVAAQRLFSHQAMLVDVAVTIRRWVVRGHRIDIAPLVLPSAALPCALFGTALSSDMVSANKPHGLSGEPTSLAIGQLGDGSRLPAAALAEAGRVRVFGDGPASRVHRFRGLSARPVASKESLIGRERRAATAFAGIHAAIIA
jgi:hypothetical protein